MATTEDQQGSRAARQEWKRELYDATPEREGELSSTISGLPNEPLYSPENVEIDYERDLGYPGVYPYTRGVYPSMYRGKLWTMRQFAGFGTAPRRRTSASATCSSTGRRGSRPPSTCRR